MLKVCVVYSFKPSAWVSCQKIVSNLLKAYELNTKKLELIPIHYADDITDYEYVQSCEKARDARPDIILFLDHKPHPLSFIQWIQHEFDEIGHKAKYIFHLYGDFTLTFKKWSGTEKLLKGQEVLWYAASERQKAMLSEFIPNDQIQVCPFPVDSKEFSYDKKLRENFRKQRGWRDDETVFIFTGRLSRQKRVHQLIRTFAEWRHKHNAKARLVFVGDCDKVGEPWLLKGEYEGEYFHHIQDVYSKLSPDEQKHIEFHGFRPNKELIGYYNGADCLVNISVHNDEDYGMSCAEALACGLPMILTSWAGFAGFQRPGLKEEVRFVPVKISPRGKLIQLSTLKTQLQHMSEFAKTYDRAKIEKLSLEWTSIENAGKIVADFEKHLKVFSEFTPNVKRAAVLEIYNNYNTFTDMKNKTFNSLYMQVYRHYVGTP